MQHATASENNSTGLTVDIRLVDNFFEGATCISPDSRSGLRFSMRAVLGLGWCATRLRFLCCSEVFSMCVFWRVWEALLLARTISFDNADVAKYIIESFGLDVNAPIPDEEHEYDPDYTHTHIVYRLPLQIALHSADVCKMLLE